MNETKTSDDLINRQAAINALWKALYEYEDKTEKQFIESEELDVGDWGNHRIFVQHMNDIDRQTILDLPSAQPDLSDYSDKLWRTTYERGKAEAVIRCKDCKYWMPHSQLGFDEENGTYHDYCGRLVPEDEYYAFYRNAEDYCSRAERREDG